MTNYIGSICLSDIPKDKITTGKDGKKYINIFIGKKREVGKYGDTHYIMTSIKKDEDSKDLYHFIGNIKPIIAQPKNTNNSTEEDLPW